MFTDLKSRKKKIYIYTEIEEFKAYDTAESRALISGRMPSPWKTCQRPGTLHYAVFPEVKQIQLNPPPSQ